MRNFSPVITLPLLLLLPLPLLGLLIVHVSAVDDITFTLSHGDEVAARSLTFTFEPKQTLTTLKELRKPLPYNVMVVAAVADDDVSSGVSEVNVGTILNCTLVVMALAMLFTIIVNNKTSPAPIIFVFAFTLLEMTHRALLDDCHTMLLHGDEPALLVFLLFLIL